MYGIFANIYHENQPNVGIYTSPMDPMGFYDMTFQKKTAWFIWILILAYFFSKALEVREGHRLKDLRFFFGEEKSHSHYG